MEVRSDSELMKGTETTHLTASSVRLVFLCGIAYFLMTVWRTGAERTPRQLDEGDGELLDIPGWKLATTQRVPTELSERLKKSFCGMMNALLEWYLNSNLESNYSASGEVSTPGGMWSKRQKTNLRTEAHAQDSFDLTCNPDDVTGIATMEIYKGKNC